MKSRGLCGETEEFSVGVRVFWFYLLLFYLILNKITKGIQGQIPWSILYEDGVVLEEESLKEVNGRYGKWREGL